MNEDELEAALREAEEAFMADVRTALGAVSAEFTRALEGATELVAARFRVSGIRDMWRGRVDGLMGRLRVVTTQAARSVADVAGGPLPDGWDEGLADYLTATRELLNEVGDHLAEEAVATLATGVAEGDDVDQLRRRLLDAFARSSQLGASRAEMIAQTEATRAWNAGSLAAAQALSGPDRPLVKQWVTRRDTRVREAHRETNGQLRLLDEPFDVDGVPMMYPGDPTAPASLTVGCRCLMVTAVAERTASMYYEDDAWQSRMPQQLKDYWLRGPGAARIGWGAPGSFRRCVSALRGDFPQDPEGLCANLYHEATGRWPGQRRGNAADTFDDTWDMPEDEAAAPRPVAWSTPGTTALAFEDEQTGDGRVFAPGSLTWTVGPWPLMFTDEIGEGHNGAHLAGSIQSMGRDGRRITGAGVLYTSLDAGGDAVSLLSQGAPLGVSVDLDDVDIELVDMDDPSAVFHVRAVSASVLPLPDGGWHVSGSTPAVVTSSGVSSVGESTAFSWRTDAKGRVPADAFTLEAAAGDPSGGGTVLEERRSGQLVTRVVRARVRSATLVPIPAYADARIVLDDPTDVPMWEDEQSYATAGYVTSTGFDYDRVVRTVVKSLVPMTAGELSKNLRIPIMLVRRYLARAASKGDIVRLTRGHYVAPVAGAEHVDDALRDTYVASLTASVTGAVDLPVASREHEWDGSAAADRVFEWAGGDVNAIARAFAYRDDEADPTTKRAYKLGYADVIGGELTIVPRGVFAAQAALDGARGGVDIPASEVDAVREHLSDVRTHVDEETGGDMMEDMEASAWAAMRDLPPMPAAWFREPTEEELPAGAPGVNYRAGRVFGWVAQAGEPHAGHAKKITIDGLGRIDTTHFLRQRFTLDDGSTVKAGSFTMNVGHHRDGAECETSACQFDDTRTVAGIVTVGMNERGMWFSGAAAPWLSTWDRTVFMATQPSYHMKRGASGAWQLRAVLAVPVPGHSSPLLASAVVDRSNMALTAAATMWGVEEAVAAENHRQKAEAEAEVAVSADSAVPALDYEKLADALVAAMARAEDNKAREARELAALREEASKLAGDL